MKIADLIVTPVAIPLKAPLLHAWGVHPGFGRVILQVMTDDGLTGLGETTLTPNGRQMEEVLRSCESLILGEDPFNLERLRWKVSNPFYVRMFGSNLTNAYAAIEFACLDIQVKIRKHLFTFLVGKRHALEGDIAPDVGPIFRFRGIHITICGDDVGSILNIRH